MIEPVEAEFAQPPIFTPAQEAVLLDEDIELARAVSNAGAPIPPPALRTEASSRSVSPTLHNAPHSPASDRTASVHDPEKGATNKTIVHFDAGESPRDWSKPKKWYATLTAALLCLMVALGSAMPTGDLEGTASALHVSNEAIFLSITLFVVGFGVGPLFFAPASELYGRKPIYAISLFFYFIFTLPSALAPNIATMLAGRMIAGLAASAPMTNVGGTVSDIWAVEERGIPMAIYSSVIFMGPCLGPLFGGWIALKTGNWRWIYWVLFIAVGVVFLCTLLMPETLSPVLLRRKANRLNKQHHTDIYIAEHDLHHVPLGTRLRTALLRPFVLMFLEPIILFMSFYLSFVYALLYATFFAFPIAFEEIRGFNIGLTGVTFLSIIIGIAIGLAVMPLQERLYKAACTRAGASTPEARLYPMMLGSIVLPIGLFILAFTSYPGIIWVGPCVAGIIFGFAMVIIYISANSYIVDSYADFAASAVAAKTFMRSLIGASVPLWITQLFHNLGFQYAGLFLALVACAILPIPFFFFVKGGAVRRRSTRASSH